MQGKRTIPVYALILLCAVFSACGVLKKSARNAIVPDRIVLTGPKTVKAGACSKAIHVVSADSDEDSAPVTESIDLTITDAGTAKFYYDSTCLVEAGTTLKMPKGYGEILVFMKKNDVGDVTFTISGGNLKAGSKTIQIAPSPAAAITLGSPA